MSFNMNTLIIIIHDNGSIFRVFTDVRPIWLQICITEILETQIDWFAPVYLSFKYLSLLHEAIA